MLSMQLQSHKYIEMAKNAINNLLTSSNLTTTESNNNVKDYLLEHESNQKVVESASQRKYTL